MKAQLVEVAWQGEHYMEAGYIQQLGFTLLYPLLTLMPLATGTMAVATTVVAHMQLVAPGVITSINMSAHRCGPATHQRIERSLLPGIANDTRKLTFDTIDDVPYLMNRPAHRASPMD